MRTEILSNWAKELEGLNSQQGLVWGILMTERMIPNYQVFSQTYQFGDVKVLEKIIYDLKNGLIQEDIEKLVENIEEQAPDTEDFGGILLASAALDAVAALYELLLFYTDRKGERLLTIGSLYLNAPYMYVHSTAENPYQTPLLQVEIAQISRWIEQICLDQPLENAENDWARKFEGRE